MENSQIEPKKLSGPDITDGKTTREKIFNFFEHPKGFWAWFVQIIILILIILSVYIFFAEFFCRQHFAKYETIFWHINNVILVIFTGEYLLRFFTAPKKGKFFVKPLNLVDFLAIFPNYIELFLNITIDTTELRVLRLVRILRFTRILRAFRIFHFEGIFKKVFSYHDTIFQSITPVIAILAALKGIFWFLEAHNWWLQTPDIAAQLANLFAIVGFALGMILSQKISMSYSKFNQVEESVVSLEGTLRSMAKILDKIKPGAGTQAAKTWAKQFLKLLEDPAADNSTILEANDKLYDAICDVPAEYIQVMAGFHASVCQGASLTLSKKVRLTPEAYDTLLHQSTLIYLLLVAVFIPGLTGMVSVLLATYMLYGMYHLTQDFDSIVGGRYNLINIDISELKHLANN